MAKRRAEPLLCHVAIKRLLREPPPLLRAAAPEQRPRGEGVGACPAAPKRKLEETEVPPGKRPGLQRSSPRREKVDAEGSRRGETTALENERTAEGCVGGRAKLQTASTETVSRRSWWTCGNTFQMLCSSSLQEYCKRKEEFSQYNSFLYWRAPLPTIDLSDIQNLDGESPPEAKTPSRTDTMETEMET